MQVWRDRTGTLVAWASLAGVASLCVIVLAKPFFLAADSAHHYAHVWYISDQLFHHARLPLRIAELESGDTLTFPYAIVPWMIAAPLRAVVGDWAVTATMVLGLLLYGYAATRARPTLRDPRLISLLYANTFLIEGFLSFQMAFIWSVALFFFYVEQIDHRRWTAATFLAIAALYTHPFAGGVSTAAYGLFVLLRRPRDARPLLTIALVTGAAAIPFAFYLSTATTIDTTRREDLVGTLEWMVRFRGLVVVLPFVLAAYASVARGAYLVLFAAMALWFGQRIIHQDVSTFGIDRYSRPFYGEFIASPQFDRQTNYRVLEPNDREDGAYQLMRAGAHLGQDFFDQTQGRRWWNDIEQYTCFLGARRIDVVLLERDYPLKFDQNEDVRLRELEVTGRAHAIYLDPAGRFAAYDVRSARDEDANISDCRL